MVSESREWMGVGLLVEKGKKLMGEKNGLKIWEKKTASWRQPGRVNAGLKWKGES